MTPTTSGTRRSSSTAGGSGTGQKRTRASGIASCGSRRSEAGAAESSSARRQHPHLPRRPSALLFS
eukprot:scaffold37224_cov66-Phaeocystis_antarctica.AAC.1